jgi:protein involved in polysaccharide export with SLBB domain
MIRRFSGQKIYVGGEVKQAGLLNLDSQVTALQAIFQSGGVLNTASLRDVVLIRRDDNSKSKFYKLDLEDPANDVFLTGYDILFVSRTNIASMDLFVEQYIDKLIPIQRSIGITFVPSQLVGINQ